LKGKNPRIALVVSLSAAQTLSISFLSFFSGDILTLSEYILTLSEVEGEESPHSVLGSFFNLTEAKNPDTSSAASNLRPF
jgi:hypothetical protein